MPIDTFVPALQPSLSSNRPAKPRTNTAQFGDGYSQRSVDGLNTVPRSYAANWPSLWSDDADAMEVFFENHTAVAFLWTPPSDTVERKWIVSDWTRGYASAGVVSLAANFVQVFDL